MKETKRKKSEGFRLEIKDKRKVVVVEPFHYPILRLYDNDDDDYSMLSSS